MGHLVKNFDIDNMKAGQSTKATILSSTAFHDVANYQGICFIVLGSTVFNSTAALAIVQSATANSTATTYQSTALSMTGVSSGQLTHFIVDCYKPEHRYIRLAVTGCSSGTCDAVVPLRYGPRLMGSTAVYAVSTQYEGSTVVVGKGT